MIFSRNSYLFLRSPPPNLCVDKIGSRPRGILCVDKIPISAAREVCVDKIGSRPRGILVYAHVLFGNRPMITFPIVNGKIVNAERISLL